MMIIIIFIFNEIIIIIINTTVVNIDVNVDALQEQGEVGSAIGRARQLCARPRRGTALQGLQVR
jgi:hypothetical protein